MYLVDTNVLSELRRGASAHPGVLRFLKRAEERSETLYVSVITIAEIRRGAALVRRRGDLRQAERIEEFFAALVARYQDRVVDFGFAEAMAWGEMRVADPHDPIDKQIAATAFTRGWTVVTRNVADFSGLGVRVLNPFDASTVLDG